MRVHLMYRGDLSGSVEIAGELSAARHAYLESAGCNVIRSSDASTDTVCDDELRAERRADPSGYTDDPGLKSAATADRDIGTRGRFWTATKAVAIWRSAFERKQAPAPTVVSRASGPDRLERYEAFRRSSEAGSVPPEPPRPTQGNDGSVVEVPLAPGPSRVRSGRTPGSRWRAATPRSVVPKGRAATSLDGWKPDLRWRLCAALLRRLEAVARWIVLRGDHPDAIPDRTTETGGGNRGVRPGPARKGEPDLPRMALGHGCPGPRIPVVLPDGIAVNGIAADAAGTAARAVLEACVVGEGAVAATLIDRLVARGARVYATAGLADDHAALAARGAQPVRVEDLPAMAPRFGLLVSTSFACFVDARVIACLPDRAAIVDVAPMPGSVDFEAAQSLGREVIWLRPKTARGGEEHAAWRAIKDIIEIGW